MQVTIFSPELRKRTGFARVSPPPSRVVILEGSYALNPAIRPLLGTPRSTAPAYLRLHLRSSSFAACTDITVAITGGVHLDLVKRCVRFHPTRCVCAVPRACVCVCSHCVALVWWYC
jgi:hypothetical protein